MMERFWSKVEKTNECWEWKAGLNRYGYGQFNHKGRPHGAHRISWMLTQGEIPKGLVIDHLCRNRKCVNPSHMELVTLGENVRRGIVHQVLSEKYASMTHCKHGHERNEENIRIDKHGHRICKPCMREHNKNQYKKSKQSS